MIKIGKPIHFLWLHGVIAAILVLNLADAVLTLWWYFSGAAMEANPFMDVLLQKGALPFVAVKLGFVSGASWVLWKRRRRAISVIGIFLLFLVYYVLLLYHLKAIEISLLGALGPWDNWPVV